MNKKLFKSLISAMLCVVLSLFAFGCGVDDKDDTSPAGETHTHELTKVEAIAATCQQAGNIEYYTCSGCDKLFADAEGQTELAADAVVIAKLAHDFETVEAENASPYGNGVVEHQECRVCGKYAVDGVETDRTDWVAYYDYIDIILPGKTKYMEQTGKKDDQGNSINEYVQVEKDGKMVRAAYFSNLETMVWPTEEDRVDIDSNNWGFSEFRIDFPVREGFSFDVVSISFDYKITVGACSQYCVVEGTDENGNPDKSYNMQHVIEYKYNNGKDVYENVTRYKDGPDTFTKEFLEMDNQWHTFTLNVSQNNMKQILLKLYHFSGEMWVTNYRVVLG